ncbi:cytochrome P450 [Ktedonosporobacter rubrisoli]|uniref:Cytochrome P450 n=1 Tax=Ktedonosporobacter rubrisoli TaxID=2509675 RepID=A0A4P6JPT2_KTERU|nr:cytochrome P450 [Ktedonosporobacter rubrisoli]QBD77160.1 cytochrome P450 [Ktedonosporobacter rubrisoli]
MAQNTLDELFSHRLNPYPFFRQMREERPFSRVNWAGREMWLATTYEDTSAILKDPRFTMDLQKVAVMMSEQGGRKEAPLRYVPLAAWPHLLNTDPPEHTRLRNLVSKAFTPRMIEQLKPRISQVTDELITAVQDKGQMDLIADFTFPLPITIILDMLGIPVADRQQFRTWTQAIVQSQGDVEIDKIEAGRTAEKEFIDYIKMLLATKHAHRDDDLTSRLIQASEQGDTLSEEEIISMVLLLITAGHETTVHLIDNGMLALLMHPEQMQLLRDDPSLLVAAVEELLRYVAPVSLSAPRWACEDISIHGHVVRKGEMVRCALLGADTDPQQFSDPEYLDILRQEKQHLSFGKGIHFCLGAPLARLEGQIAIEALLKRLPNLQLACAPEQLVWQNAGSLRVLAALPLKF